MSWWQAREVCPVCGSEGLRHHSKRHQQSKMHQRALQRQYTTMASDVEFTEFLNSIRPSNLRGYERRLYQHYRERMAA